MLIFGKDCLFCETDFAVFSNSFPQALVYHKVEALSKQHINCLKAKKCCFPKDKLLGASKTLLRTYLELVS